MGASSLENTIDLSHIPTVPHSMSMPRYLTVNTVPRRVITTPQSKRPRNGNEAENINESSKRLCLESANQRVARVLSNEGFQPLRIPTAPVTLAPQAIGSSFVAIPRPANNEHVKENQNPSKLYIIKNTVYDVTKLQEENAHLRSENNSLQKQVSLFKQLMRNPQRLQSVLQRLNEKTNQ